MNLGLEGKVALVLGASKGIGRGVAHALAREGATVAVSSRSKEGLAAVVDEMGSGRAFPADTDDLDRMAELPGEVSDSLGSLDVLVTNTGGPPPGGALDHDVRGVGEGLQVTRSRPAGDRRDRTPRDA